MSKIAVNEITNEAGTGAPSFNEGINATSLNGGQFGGRRNLIINGAMQVAQRGTSVTGSTANSTYQTVDRWVTHSSGATYNASQEEVSLGGETGLPEQFKYYFRFNPTTGANNTSIWQHVEDVTRVQGIFTLSFYAKGTNPGGGSVKVELDQYLDTFSPVDEKIFSFTLTNTWQKYSFTFTPASLSGQTINDSNSSYRISFGQPDGDNSTDAWTLDITGVQLEVGDTATEFEHRSYGEELALCQRYFERIGGGNYAPIGNGMQRQTDQSHTQIYFKTTKRAPPTESRNNIVTTDRFIFDEPITGISQFYPTTYGAQIQYTHNSVGAERRPILISAPSAQIGYVDFDAEL